MAESTGELEERTGESVEWLELFFDLVVVAAVAVLTEGLREEATWAAAGLFALLYAAVWLAWVSVVLYANVAQERTRVPTVVLAMFLLAAMAAAAPGEFERRADVFAGAFLLVRAMAGRGSMATGKVLQGWPLLQFGGLALPWIVAMWVPAPEKYWLWTLGLVFDLGVVVFRGDTPVEQQVERMRRRMGRAGQERQARRRHAAGAAVQPPDLEVVAVETGHLDERLGLFMIIVLGEAVSQLVLAAASEPWTAALLCAAVLGFLMLAGLWWLTFSFGFTAAPHARLAALPPRFSLPLHLASTLGIAALATGLGESAFHADEPLGEVLRWVMCAGLSLHVLVTGVSGYAAGAPWRWTLGWALPCTLVPLALAGLGERVPNALVALGLLLCVAWLVAYSLLARSRLAEGLALTRAT